MNENNISITYFKGYRGWAQFSRVAFSYLGIPYDNIEIESISSLGPVIDDTLKSKLPFGQVPILKDGDFVVSQSHAIALYIAGKYKIGGNNLKEQARVNEIISSVHSDLFTNINPVNIDKEKLFNVIFPRLFGKIEKDLNKNKFIIGDSVTMADIYAYVAYDYMQHRGFQDKVNAINYPKLDELKSYFENNTGVKEYIKNRPITQY